MRFLLILLFLGTLLGGIPALGNAQTADGVVETPALILERWGAEVNLIDLRLNDETLGTAEIDSLRAILEAQRTAAPQMIADAKSELEPLLQQFEALGGVVVEPGTKSEQAAAEPLGTSTETEKITAERAALARQIAAVEAVLKRSGQAKARAAALISRLSTLRRELFSRALLSRGPGIFDTGAAKAALASIRQVAGAISAETADLFSAHRIRYSFFVRVLRTLVPLALLGAALFMVLGAKPAALRWLMRPTAEGAPHKRRVMTGIGVILVRILAPAIALFITLAVIWTSGLLGPRGEILTRGLASMVLVVIGAYALGGSFYAPHAPQLRLSALPEAAAASAHRWMMAIAGIVGLNGVLVVRGAEIGLAIEAQALLNIGLLVLGSIAVWNFTAYLKPATDDGALATPQEADSGSDHTSGGEPTIGPLLITAARVIARTAAVAASALALIGYFGASRYIFYPVIVSGAVVGLCILLFYAVHDTVDRYIAPEGDDARPQSRVRLIPVAVAFLLFSAALPILALIWGADPADLAHAWRWISDGFAIGDMVISPIDFFAFLLIFSIGYVLTRVLQGVLSRSVLPLTGLDAGGKAAIRAGVGYVGIILAALVAISATGLDLSKLAIVVGALSVGIGFGLQNVVNNFVSGLILLIERPIKEGDWIELTSGSGYVKKVNVRSTEIQTFDRAALIVPNSELISGPVTNWTHSNLNGRLKVPVGVAYGTDPRKVETILTEIAKAHPMLLNSPEPYVLFLSFGADALEFEIRGVLRDVNWIMNTTSDINFEISRRFEEAGIEIPFAQRDLHIRNAGELGQSFASAMRGGQKTPAVPPKPKPQPPRRPPVPPEAAGNEPDSDS